MSAPRGPRDLGRLLSARDAEKVHGISASTIRTWWQRRARTGLWDYGRDRRNAPLFRECDLLALSRGERLPPRVTSDSGIT